MSKSKRERIILGLLLAVLLFAGWNLWGRLTPETNSPPVAGRVEVQQPLDTERFSSLDVTPEWTAGFDQREGAGRDPFQYGSTASTRPVPQPPPPEDTFVRPPAPSRPPAPPPPPPLPLQFVGFSRVGGPAAELRAVLMGDDGLPYPALAGETIMGRYRVEEVTEGFVVVEDLASGRRERLAVSLQD